MPVFGGGEEGVPKTIVFGTRQIAATRRPYIVLPQGQKARCKRYSETPFRTVSEGFFSETKLPAYLDIFGICGHCHYRSKS